MKIIVTGFPRNRTSLIINLVADKFNLKRPANLWGETYKFGETIENWLPQSDSIYKLWPIHSTDFIKTLEKFDGNIIVSYTEDFPLFVAKLLRSHITTDWGIDKKTKERISFRKYMVELQDLKPLLFTFRNSLLEVMSNQKIVLKSAFINKDQVAVHIQSSISPELVEHLRDIAKDYIAESVSDYILESTEEFYDFVHTTFGSTI